MERIVGIDLGTTNSEIAFLGDEGPVVVDIDGDAVMPSAVGLAPGGELIVGRAARNQMVSHPESTILSIKRRMGESSKVTLGEKQLSPEELSSLILRQLAGHAAAALGAEVRKAVITVPAYFNERQREATRNAGELAGLEVVRIINEPTAAAMAYEAGHEGDRTILVYDLGGGTFDASLVVVNKGVVEVKASHGDTKLGGDDFDQLLARRVAEEFESKHGVGIGEDPGTLRRLWVASEKAKRHLSDNPYVRIREELFVGDLHLDVEVSRMEYEEMIAPLLRRARDCVHRCLRDGGMLPGQVDEVILVGGSSRTPLVHNLLAEDLGKQPRYEVNPDLIVAMGAAIQAGVVGGMPAKAVLVDITPYTFGTSAIGEHQGALTPGVFVPLIRRNTPLPTTKSEAFDTVTDNQESVQVEVYQGEKELARENTFVGSFMVHGLSEVPAGNTVVLTMKLDVNGMLEVTAVEKRTGLSKSVTMDTREGESRLDMGHARRNLADWTRPPAGEGGEPVDAEFWQAEETPSPPGADKTDEVTRAKDLRKRAERLLPGVSEEDAAEVRSLLDRAARAIGSSDMRALGECNESLSDMIFYLED